MFCTNVDLVDIHKNYSKMMSRKRPESVLPLENFVYHFENMICNGTAGVYGNPKDGYILGKMIYVDDECIFMPSHFAPTSLKNGVKLLTSIRKDITVSVVLAITEDLKDMLSRMTGYYTLNGLETNMFFRNMFVKKYIYSNNGYILEKISHLINNFDMSVLKDFFNTGNIFIEKINQQEPLTTIDIIENDFLKNIKKLYSIRL